MDIITTRSGENFVTAATKRLSKKWISIN